VQNPNRTLLAQTQNIFFDDAIDPTIIASLRDKTRFF